MDQVYKKIDEIKDSIHDIKKEMVGLNYNYDRCMEILERLTVSVEHHIKRTDEIQDMVVALKEQNSQTSQTNALETEKMKNEQNLKIAALSADLANKKDNDRNIWIVLVAVGGFILGLKQLGILDKLL